MKKIIKYSLLVFVFLISVFGCASPDVRVMPQESGYIFAVARDRTRERAERAAFEGAEEYCKVHQKQLVVRSDQSTYDGKIDENTRKVLNAAGTVTYFMADGALFPIGYGVHSYSNGKDYQSRIEFKCI